MGKEKIRNKNGILTAVYKLGKYERVNTEEVKILVNGRVRGLAPVAVYEKRWKTELEICQHFWTPLSAYQGSYLTDSVLMSFLKHTLQIAYDCERYGLRIDNLCWDQKKVYVDRDGNVRMIYWPVTTLEQNSATALEFYREFCAPIQRCTGIDQRIAKRYTAYFYQRQHFDFPAFRQLLMELVDQWRRAASQRTPEEDNQNPREKPGKAPCKYYGSLEWIQTGTHFAMDKDCISIGRDSRQCQVHLKGCRLVGRLHAQILLREGQYYLVDKGSINGTSVDGVRLEPERRWPLVNGARICFADQEFVFREMPGHNTISIHQMKRGIL